MILPYQEIIKLCEGGWEDEAGGKGDKEKPAGTKRPPRPEPLLVKANKGNVKSASYDLRLGGAYHLADGSRSGLRFWRRKAEVERLDENNKRLTIPPNHAVVVTTYESVNLPLCLVGHLSLKLGLLTRGLIMASQSQMDAGYGGSVFILLYNLSNRDVTLKYRESIARLEFAKLSEDTERGYKGQYGEQGKNELQDVIEEPIGSSLFAMQKSVNAATTKITWASVLGAVVVIATGVLATLIPLAWDNYSKVSEARGKVDTFISMFGQTEDKLKDMENRIKDAQQELKAINEQIKNTQPGQLPGQNESAPNAPQRQNPSR